MAINADGSAVIVFDADVSDAEKKIGRLKTEIQNLEVEINKKEFKRNALAEQMENAAKKAAEADAKVLDLYTELQKVNDQKIYAESIGESAKNIDYLTAKQADLNQKIAMASVPLEKMNAEYDELKASVDKLNTSIAEDKLNLEAAQYAGGLLQAKINQAAKETTALSDGSSALKNATRAASGNMDRLVKKMGRLASKVFVFTFAAKALRILRDALWNVVKNNNKATAAISTLKGALLTLAQPLINVIIPVFTKLVNILAKIAAMAANVVSRLFGTTAKASAEAAENLYKETNAIENVGDAAKGATKSLAGFDEINTLSTGESNVSSANTSNSGTITPDFSSVIDQKLGEIEIIVGGALLALGAILAFSGVNVPLGISLMAAGALTLAATIKDNWDVIKKELQGQTGALLAILSVALLVLGAILTFSGANIGLGIGLMVAGAAGLATVEAINWDSIKEALQGPIGVLVGILSAALLVLGAVLTFSGANIGLGIGLMIVGATGLAEVVGVKWDSIEKALQGPLGRAFALLSSVLLILGAIFTFSGAAIPLGLGMMAVGAAGLAADIVANWSTIESLLQGPIGAVVGIVSAALLVLGVILLFSGAGVALGLGLIVAGGVGLAAAIAPNWDFIKDKISDAWQSVKTFWDAHIAKYFTAEWWKQRGKDMLNGLMESLETGLNRALSGAGDFVNRIIDILNKIPGIDIGHVDWGHVTLPRLAQGAVIPPNREFLAVLGDQKSGTNIEAPLSTIEQAVENVLARRGFGGGGEQTVILQLDRRELGRVVYKLNNEESRRIGVTLTGV